MHRSIACLAGAVLLLSTPLAGASAASSDDAERLARVEAVFAPYARDDAPGCSVAVGRGGDVLLAKGYGVADLGWKQPIAPSTPFDIGSTSKQFIAFAVLLQADRGRLSLDDDVRTHVPELPDYGVPVPLWSLLDHTSGFPDYLALANVTGRPSQAELTTARALDLVRRIPALQAEPGSDFNYSNVNYVLLAEVVRRVDGRPVERVLAEEVFGPLGMADTRFESDPTVVVPGRGRAYVRRGDGFVESMSAQSDNGGKGVQSTPRDLLVWQQALADGRIGSPGVLRWMTTPRATAARPDAVYATGLAVADYRGKRTWRHSGAFGGWQADLVRVVDDGIGVAVTCNRGDAIARDLASRVLDAWYGDALAPLPPRASVTPRWRAALGTWVADDGRSLELVERDGLLAVAGPPRALYVVDADSVRSGPAENVLTLRLRGDGDEAALEWRESGDVPVVYRRRPASLPPVDGQALAGRYLSRAYHAVLPIDVRDGAAGVVGRTGDWQPMRATGIDRFEVGGFGVRLRRDATGRVDAVVVGGARASGILFERLSD